jgi:sterol desaturase/sphingolipid hydroxylase (fatty acid hydroxylase superfamily)
MELKTLAVVVGLVVFGLLELRQPFFKYPQPFVQRVSTNLLLGGLNTLVVRLTVVVLSQTYCGAPTWYHLLAGVADRGGVGPIAAGAIALVLLDAYMYGWHWLMHRWPPAWGLHRIHHTDTAMNTSTTYRFHPLEVVLSYLPKMALLWVVGIPLEICALYETLFSLVVLFQHSNWALPYGVDRVLSTVVVTPNYHRVHHSQAATHQGRNYASVLTVWDALFGTQHYPQHPEQICLGVAEDPIQA